MAILLQEEGLYDRTTIYATDFNQSALNSAKEGIFSNKLIKEYTANYHHLAVKNRSQIIILPLTM
jgi:chemotaxis protein methyltransferase CheR